MTPGRRLAPGAVRALLAPLALVVTLLAGVAGCAPLGGGAPETTVYLVRHAERASAPADDPVLTPAGEARARALAAELANAGITRILVTPRQRTALTAAPLARARGITPEVIALGSSTAGHVDAVAAAIRALPAGTKVLVVGHSNTIPRIVTALGGPPFRDLCDGEYQTLYTVRLRAGRAAQAETRPYGAPDAPGASDCPQSPNMMR